MEVIFLYVQEVYNMGVVDFAEYVKQAIQAGQSIEGNVVRVIADNGDDIGNAVFKVIQGGNGTASEVGVAVKVGAGGATTTGLAFLALDVSVVGAAIAPALGILAGVGLYNLAPEFWTNVSNALLEAGQTVGGKVIGYWNGDNVHLSQETIEIFKNALLAEGAFNPVYDPDISSNAITTVWKTFNALGPIGLQNTLERLSKMNSLVVDEVYRRGFNGFQGESVPVDEVVEQLKLLISEMASTSISTDNAVTTLLWGRCDGDRRYNGTIGLVYLAIATLRGTDQIQFYDSSSRKRLRINNVIDITIGTLQHNRTAGGGPWLRRVYKATDPANFNNYGYIAYPYTTEPILNSIINFANPAPETFDSIPYLSLYDLGVGSTSQNPNTQPGATFPSLIDFWLTYPEWVPWDYPLPDPGELPKVYPIKYPGTNPDPYPGQEGAQDPDEEPAPEIIPIITPGFPIPTPKEDPFPEEEEESDPEEDDDEDPIEDQETGTDEPDPIDPVPPPPPTPVIPVVPLPSTVSSNKLFTVYNPSSSQLDSLGGYLWNASLIATLTDIWQDPIDGIISLIQVYATPSTSGSHNIILGYLDSGVSAPVVGNQFVTVDCGSVQVNENKKNATDYAPYTSLHLYLPFIGIVELDANECMNSTISIKYRVDVYTGTCLALVSVNRTEDMPHSPILYTYSGNCAQQLPLTSGNATGLLTALIGAVATGLTAGSGGALSTAAGLSIAGQSLSHEMMHVNHSGNLSANAGIMGNKKPYIIIGRRHAYDANNYNSLYGFPANKTVVLGNHDGYVKVKKCWLKTSATQPEYDKIMELLADGIFL